MSAGIISSPENVISATSSPVLASGGAMLNSPSARAEVSFGKACASGCGDFWPQLKSCEKIAAIEIYSKGQGLSPSVLLGRCVCLAEKAMHLSYKVRNTGTTPVSLPSSAPPLIPAGDQSSSSSSLPENSLEGFGNCLGQERKGHGWNPEGELDSAALVPRGFGLSVMAGLLDSYSQSFYVAPEPWTAQMHSLALGTNRARPLAPG